MSLAILGRGGFEDAYLPVKGKSEWGMDTLTRKLEGARSLLEAFIATLSQGQIYQGYFLQTWESDDNPVKATVTLNYKGLLTGGTPIPDVQTEIVSTSGHMAKSYQGDDGRGIILRYIQLFRLFYTAPGGPAVEEDTVVARRPVYTTSATLDFLYHAVESKYRYINDGKPAAPRYSEVDSLYVPTVEDVRITTSDGMIYGRGQLAGLNMTPVLHPRVVAHTSKNVIGSPFYECEDSVRLELIDPLEFPP